MLWPLDVTWIRNKCRHESDFTHHPCDESFWEKERKKERRVRNFYLISKQLETGWSIRQFWFRIYASSSRFHPHCFIPLSIEFILYLTEGKKRTNTFCIVGGATNKASCLALNCTIIISIMAVLGCRREDSVRVKFHQVSCLSTVPGGLSSR